MPDLGKILKKSKVNGFMNLTNNIERLYEKTAHT